MARLFIVNPLSARIAKKGSVLSDIAKDTGTALIRLDDFSALPGDVAQAAQSGIEHVFIEGGDGTVQGVLSEFLRQAESFGTFPKFSIVPGGMTNQVAKNIGLKSAKRRAVKAAMEGDTNSISVPMLKLSSDTAPTQYGFLLSTGAVPQITTFVASDLHKKGIGGSFAVIGGILKGLRGTDSDLMQTTPIDLDGLHSGDHLGTVVTTLPSLILGLDPFWGDSDGPVRVTWVEGEYHKLTRHILGLWLGRKDVDRRADGFHSARTDELRYAYNGPTVLDGEFLSFPSGKFTVRATRPVTFLR